MSILHRPASPTNPFKPLRPVERTTQRPQVVKPRRKPTANPRDGWPTWTDARYSTVEPDGPRPTALPSPEHSAVDEAFWAGYEAGRSGENGWLSGPGVTDAMRLAFIRGREAARPIRPTGMTDLDVHPAGVC